MIFKDDMGIYYTEAEMRTAYDSQRASLEDGEKDFDTFVFLNLWQNGGNIATVYDFSIIDTHSGMALTCDELTEKYEDYVYWCEFDGEHKADTFNQWLNTAFEAGSFEEVN